VVGGAAHVVPEFFAGTMPRPAARGNGAGSGAGARWRAFLMGTAAAGALLYASPKPARAGPDACGLGGGVATCQGNQSAGIASGVDFAAGYTTLNVNTLTQNIAPAAGTDGINFTGTGAVTVNSNTGAFSIQTTGTGQGIYARAGGANAANVTHTGDVTATNGNGIYAFSAGGGVTVNSTGDVTSTSSQGIFARVIGAGAVSVTHTGDVNAATDGIDAASTGGNATVAINGGTVTGATNGVRFRYGGTNTLNVNAGTVTSPGTAVRGDFGDETVNNAATVTGNVGLGTGTNAFNNLAGGVFNSGATVNLGAGNDLTNAGTVQPGGAGAVQTTALGSNFVQNAGGRTVFDIDLLGSTYDQITVDETATVNGTVAVNLLNVAPGVQAFQVVQATGGAAGAPTLETPAAVQGALAVNANDVTVTLAVDFGGASGLTANQRSVATSLDAILAAGADDLLR